MRFVQIAILIVLALACALSIATMVQARRSWHNSVNDLVEHGGGMDLANCCEHIPGDEFNVLITKPFRIELASRDPGLTPTVLFLALLFVLLIAFRKALPAKVGVYFIVFLVCVMAADAGLIIDQNIFLPKVYRAYRDKWNVQNPILTTEHGAKLNIHGMDIRATVRDPNIIPLLMVSSFFVLWFPLERFQKRRSRGRPKKSEGSNQ